MKLVRENLFEKFSEDGDPIADMGIGLIKMFKKIQKKLEDAEAWDLVDKDNEELTSRFSMEFTYETENFYSMSNHSFDWNSIGVYAPFKLTYTIDIIMSKNYIIRSLDISNLDIKDLYYTYDIVLINDIIKNDIDNIIYIIINDKDSFMYISDIISDAANEAWEIAKVDDQNVQKRIKS
jgi:hypothetical protein